MTQLSLLADLSATPPAMSRALPPNPTLADVAAFIAAYPDQTPAQRKERLSCLRCLAKILGRDLSMIPAKPATLTPQINAVAPAAHGITTGRWCSIRSYCLTAMALAGIKVMRGRSTTKLTPAWQQLEMALPTRQAQHGLSRFFRFCVDEGVPPAEVTEAVFTRFREALLSTSMAKSPHTIHRVACVQWNKAVEEVAGWPAVRIPVPANPRLYSFDWSDFPATLVADTKAFLRHAGSSNPFDDDYRRKVRPATIVLRRRQIRQMASLLVHSGVPIAEVASLADLIKGLNARRILEACHERLGDGAVQLHGMALLLKTIAQQWIKAPPAVVAEIAGYARNLAVPAGQMTEKNRNRLRQFDDPETLDALLDLPRAVFHDLKKRKDPPDRADALRAMNALAVEFLIVAPLRIANLTSLDLSRHIIQVGRGPRARQHIVIPPEEAKTKIPYEMVIPAETAALMATYGKVYLPIISATPTTVLFPNQHGACRCETGLAQAMSKFLRREIGIVMNVHLFRHNAVTQYLKHHPDDLETARRILGHANTNMVSRRYADIKTAAAFARYDDMIGNLRSELRRGRPKPSPRPRRT